MPKGGKRINAGAKPRNADKSFNRTIRMTDAEWEAVKLKSANYKTVSDYIRFKALSE